MYFPALEPFARVLFRSWSKGSCLIFSYLLSEYFLSYVVALGALISLSFLSELGDGWQLGIDFPLFMGRTVLGIFFGYACTVASHVTTVLLSFSGHFSDRRPVDLIYELQSLPIIPPLLVIQIHRSLSSHCLLAVRLLSACCLLLMSRFRAGVASPRA